MKEKILNIYSMPIILLLAFCLSIFTKIQCQELLPASNRYLKYASRAVEMKDYYTAAEMLEKYLVSNPNDEKTIKQLAECYYLTKQFYKADKIYTDLLSDNANDKNIMFCYAKTKKALGQYDDAIEYFQKCRKVENDRDVLVKCRQEIVGCEEALESLQNPRDVVIMNQENINSNHLDGSPMFINDSFMIYTSMKLDQMERYSIYDSSEIKYSNLYIAELQDSIWDTQSEFQIFPDKIDYNIGNGALSIDRERFYFTICKNNWLNKSVCSLCVASYKDGDIKDAKVLGDIINSKNYTSTHPTTGNSYSDDLDVIYFSSDRPGGLGGMDIWYTVYNKIRKSYSKPKNLGGKINSAYNEITPFYNNSTKTLYYSSDIPVGYGGYDIYKSTGDLRNWHVTSNIGYPFNTNSDEMYYTVNENQIDGFLVSNRLGSKTLIDDFCCYDIYSLKIKNEGRVILKGSYIASIEPSIERLLNKGLELTSETNILEQEMEVALYMYFDESLDSMFVINDTLDIDGNYELLAESDNEYKLFFYNENKIQSSLSVSTKNINTKETKEISLGKTEISVLPKQALIVNNITYEFGSSQLTDMVKQVIDSSIVIVLKENPKIKVEISSHTDSVGDNSYNVRLSEQRAANVVEYLISCGINKSRLVAKGYGESSPLHPNTNPDGSDNPEGRRKNRRTEFKILEATPNVTNNARRSVF